MVVQVEAGADALSEQRKLLQEIVATWASDYADRIGETYLREEPPGVFFLLTLLKGIRYDDVLTGSMIEMELEIAHDP